MMEEDLFVDDLCLMRVDVLWGFVMDRYVMFLLWFVDGESGVEYELCWEVCFGSDCEDGLC